MDPARVVPALPSRSNSQRGARVIAFLYARAEEAQRSELLAMFIALIVVICAAGCRLSYHLLAIKEEIRKLRKVDQS